MSTSKFKKIFCQECGKEVIGKRCKCGGKISFVLHTGWKNKELKDGRRQ